ncbi:MAG: aspartate kinase, partial [Phototrophicaceae bacterium]
DKLPLNTEARNALQTIIDRILFEMLDTCQTLSDHAASDDQPDTTDAIIGVGERIAARITAALLRHSGLRAVTLDTTELIITDSARRTSHLNIAETRARIEEHLLPMLEREIIPVITGFIASTPAGKTTTLGRGGSDFTASIVSVMAGADELWMWTAFDGIMTTDPREVTGAQVIPELSYDEAAEMAYFGARILHTRMIEPLREHKIPVYVKNVFKPQLLGTCIHYIADPQPPRIKAVTAIAGIALTANRSGSATDVISAVHETLIDPGTIGTPIDVMITGQTASQTTLCFVIPTSAGPGALEVAQAAIQRRLSDDDQLDDWRVFPVTVITAIGSLQRQQPRLLARVFAALDDTPIVALSQSPARSSLSIAVQPADAPQALQRIHALTIEPVTSDQ